MASESILDESLQKSLVYFNTTFSIKEHKLNKQIQQIMHLFV